MYGSSLMRCAILAAFAVLASQSPSMDRFPFIIDGWLFLSLRMMVGEYGRWLPIIVFGAGILADFLAPWLPRCSVPVRHAGRWAVTLTVVAGLGFWLARVPFWFGDCMGVDGVPIPELGFQPSELLGQILSTSMRMLGAAVGVKSSTAMAVETILYGSTAVAALFLWSRTVSTQWPLVFGMLTSCGFMVLFCGYVEISTPKSVAVVCWYVYFMTTALRAWQTRPLFLANVFLALAGLIHGSALCWLPAHIWTIWRHARGRFAVAVSIAGFLLPIVAWSVFFIVVRPRMWTPLGNMTAPIQWFEAYCVTNCEYDFWSVAHLFDIVNCLLILSPMAILCLPEAFWHARSVAARWLALGAVGWLFLSVIWFPVFGHLGDWDIFAGTPLVLSYFGILVAVEVMAAKQLQRLAYAWLVVSLLHTLSWWNLFRTPP